MSFFKKNYWVKIYPVDKKSFPRPTITTKPFDAEISSWPEIVSDLERLDPQKFSMATGILISCEALPLSLTKELKLFGLNCEDYYVYIVPDNKSGIFLPKKMCYNKTN